MSWLKKEENEENSEPANHFVCIMLWNIQRLQRREAGIEHSAVSCSNRKWRLILENRLPERSSLQKARERRRREKREEKLTAAFTYASLNSTRRPKSYENGLLAGISTSTRRAQSNSPWLNTTKKKSYSYIYYIPMTAAEELRLRQPSATAEIQQYSARRNKAAAPLRSEEAETEKWREEKSEKWQKAV